MKESLKKTEKKFMKICNIEKISIDFMVESRVIPTRIDRSVKELLPEENISNSISNQLKS